MGDVRRWSRTKVVVWSVVLALALAGLVFLGSAWATAGEVRERAELSGKGQGVTVAELPDRWIEWLILVEDPAFFTHHGVDMSTPGAGWTTITQGLVKLHYPGPSRGLLGKPIQSVRAVVLNRVIGKQEQLTLFLNTAYFGATADGRPIHGFPLAAREIYGRELAELSDDQFIGLVAMLVGPNRFHPIRDPSRHAERVGRIRSLIEGTCAPTSWRDVYLSACAPGSAP